MHSVLRVFGVTFLAAQVLGKVTHHHSHLLDHHNHHHHHQHDHGHQAYHHGHHSSHHHGGFHSYAAVLAAEPVVTKAVSAGPVVLSKGVAHAPAPLSVHSHAPAYTVAAAPVAAVSHVPSAAYTIAPAISHEHVALLATAGKPKVYQKSVPAAAIRNIETVMVTKTITPVVTKTTTYLTKAEPALSLGHVQGYKQGAVGHVKVAPVQFNTAYTTFANPTVGINGPVIYKGPALGVAPVAAIAAAAPVAVGPEPVIRKPIGAPALHHAHHGRGYYQGHHAYATHAVVPGAGLAYDGYGIDAHAVPVTNFLELKQGTPVFSHGHAAYAAYAHK